MKKRNKKYNPNKLVNLVQRESQKPYEALMGYQVESQIDSRDISPNTRVSEAQALRGES